MGSASVLRFRSRKEAPVIIFKNSLVRGAELYRPLQSVNSGWAPVLPENSHFVIFL